MIKRLLRLLASGWLTAFILFVFLAVYVFLRINGAEGSEFLNHLFHNTWLVGLYLLFLLNLLANSIESIRGGLKMNLPDIKCMDARAEFLKDRWPMIREAFREFNLPDDLTNRLYIKNGRWSFLPALVVKTGLILSLIALLISANYRQASKRQVHIGDVFSVFDINMSVKRVDASMKKEYLKIGQKGNFSVDEAVVTLQQDERFYKIVSGHPVRIDGVYLRVVHLGITQDVTVIDKKGRLTSLFDLDLFPPGRTALVKLPSRDYFLTFTLHPERKIKKGILTGEVYNLEKFLYRVVLQSGNREHKTFSSIIREGHASLVNGVNIRLGKRGFYATIQIVRDPGLGLLRSGLMILVIGLILLPSRAFWYTREIYIVPEEQKIKIGYSEEFFKKWAINRFHRVVDDLISS